MMNSVAKVFLIPVLVLLAASCVGTQLEKAQRVEPKGSTFNVSLYQEYIDLSSSEYNEGDYTDSDNFAVRAMQSGTGGTVAPEEISARRLPEDKVGELTSARQRLVGTLSKGAAEKLPAETARAQTGFDCWMQEQEENFQPDDIEACRSQFFAALEYIEDALKPKPIAKKVEPPVAPPPASELYLVYFDFDKAELSEAAKAVLETASSAARKLKGMTVTVSGHTDLAGTADYNVELSKRRAIAVSEALIKTGVASAAVKAEAFGQTFPAIITADGVAEAGNRRVEILIGVK
jgi:outer membrane protein OmpA-like peptidoglycan-associated protein